MIRIISMLALGLGLVAGAMADTQWRGGSPEDRQAIRDIIAVWEAGYATGDAAAVAGGYDPQGYVMAEGAPIAGPEQVRAGLEKTFADNTINMLLDVMEVEFNGSWVFLAGRFASKRTPKDPAAGGAPRYHAGHFFTLLHKTDAGWKVWRNVDTSSPDANYLLQQLRES